MHLGGRSGRVAERKTPAGGRVVRVDLDERRKNSCFIGVEISFNLLVMSIIMQRISNISVLNYRSFNLPYNIP